MNNPQVFSLIWLSLWQNVIGLAFSSPPHTSGNAPLPYSEHNTVHENTTGILHSRSPDPQLVRVPVLQAEKFYYYATPDNLAKFPNLPVTWNKMPADLVPSGCPVFGDVAICPNLGDTTEKPIVGSTPAVEKPAEPEKSNNTKPAVNFEPEVWYDNLSTLQSAVTSSDTEVEPTEEPAPSITEVLFDDTRFLHELSQHHVEALDICRSYAFEPTQLNYFIADVNDWLRDYIRKNRDREYMRRKGPISTLAFDFLGLNNYMCGIDSQHLCVVDCPQVVKSVKDLETARRVYFALASASHFNTVANIIYSNLGTAQTNVGLMIDRIASDYNWATPAPDEAHIQEMWEQGKIFVVWATNQIFQGICANLKWEDMGNWMGLKATKLLHAGDSNKFPLMYQPSADTVSGSAGGALDSLSDLIGSRKALADLPSDARHALQGVAPIMKTANMPPVDVGPVSKYQLPALGSDVITNGAFADTAEIIWEKYKNVAPPPPPPPITAKDGFVIPRNRFEYAGSIMDRPRPFSRKAHDNIPGSNSLDFGSGPANIAASRPRVDGPSEADSSEFSDTVLPPLPKSDRHLLSPMMALEGGPFQIPQQVSMRQYDSSSSSESTTEPLPPLSEQLKRPNDWWNGDRLTGMNLMFHDGDLRKAGLPDKYWNPDEISRWNEQAQYAAGNPELAPPETPRLSNEELVVAGKPPRTALEDMDLIPASLEQVEENSNYVPSDVGAPKKYRPAYAFRTDKKGVVVKVEVPRDNEYYGTNSDGEDISSRDPSEPPPPLREGEIPIYPPPNQSWVRKQRPKRPSPNLQANVPETVPVPETGDVSGFSSASYQYSTSGSGSVDSNAANPSDNGVLEASRRKSQSSSSKSAANSGQSTADINFDDHVKKYRPEKYPVDEAKELAAAGESLNPPIAAALPANEAAEFSVSPPMFGEKSRTESMYAASKKEVQNQMDEQRAESMPVTPKEIAAKEDAMAAVVAAELIWDGFSGKHRDPAGSSSSEGPNSAKSSEVDWLNDSEAEKGFVQKMNGARSGLSESPASSAGYDADTDNLRPLRPNKDPLKLPPPKARVPLDPPSSSSSSSESPEPPRNHKMKNSNARTQAGNPRHRFDPAVDFIREMSAEKDFLTIPSNEESSGPSFSDGAQSNQPHGPEWPNPLKEDVEIGFQTQEAYEKASRKSILRPEWAEKHNKNLLEKNNPKRLRKRDDGPETRKDVALPKRPRSAPPMAPTPERDKLLQDIPVSEDMGTPHVRSGSDPSTVPYDQPNWKEAISEKKQGQVPPPPRKHCIHVKGSGIDVGRGEPSPFVNGLQSKNADITPAGTHSIAWCEEPVAPPLVHYKYTEPPIRIPGKPARLHNVFRHNAMYDAVSEIYRDEKGFPRKGEEPQDELYELVKDYWNKIPNPVDWTYGKVMGSKPELANGDTKNSVSEALAPVLEERAAFPEPGQSFSSPSAEDEAALSSLWLRIPETIKNAYNLVMYGDNTDDHHRMWVKPNGEVYYEVDLNDPSSPKKQATRRYPDEEGALSSRSANEDGAASDTVSESLWSFASDGRVMSDASSNQAVPPPPLPPLPPPPPAPPQGPAPPPPPPPFHNSYIPSSSGDPTPPSSSADDLTSHISDAGSVVGSFATAPEYLKGHTSLSEQDQAETVENYQGTAPPPMVPDADTRRVHFSFSSSSSESDSTERGLDGQADVSPPTVPIAPVVPAKPPIITLTRPITYPPLPNAVGARPPGVNVEDEGPRIPPPDLRMSPEGPAPQDPEIPDIADDISFLELPPPATGPVDMDYDGSMGGWEPGKGGHGVHTMRPPGFFERIWYRNKLSTTLPHLPRRYQSPPRWVFDNGNGMKALYPRPMSESDSEYWRALERHKRRRSLADIDRWVANKFLSEIMVFGSDAAKTGINALRAGGEAATGKLASGVAITANVMNVLFKGDKDPGDPNNALVVNRFSSLCDTLETARSFMATKFLSPVSQQYIPNWIKNKVTTHEYKSSEKGKDYIKAFIVDALHDAGMAGRSAMKDHINKIFNAPEINEDGSTELTDAMAMGSFLPTSSNALALWTDHSVEKTLTRNLFFRSLNELYKGQQIWISCTPTFLNKQNPTSMENPHSAITTHCELDNTGPQNLKACIKEQVCYMYRWTDRGGKMISHHIEEPYGWNHMQGEPWRLTPSDVITSSVLTHYDLGDPTEPYQPTDPQKRLKRANTILAQSARLQIGPDPDFISNPATAGVFTVPVCASRYNWNGPMIKPKAMSPKAWFDVKHTIQTLPCYCGDLGADTMEVWEQTKLAYMPYADSKYKPLYCGRQISEKISHPLDRWIATCRLNVGWSSWWSALSTNGHKLCGTVIEELEMMGVRDVTTDLVEEEILGILCKIDPKAGGILTLENCKRFKDTPVSEVWKEAREMRKDPIADKRWRYWRKVRKGKWGKEDMPPLWDLWEGNWWKIARWRPGWGRG